MKVDVRVMSAANGSGAVRVTATLDKEAASQAGALEVDDLKQAGWTVTTVEQKGGGRVVTASHHFDTPADLRVLMAEVGAPFKDFRLRTTRSLLTTRTRFTGTVDLRDGLGAFSDADLRARLGGSGIGLDPAAIKDASGVDIDNVLDLAVTVAVPGQTISRHPKLGEITTRAASASHYNTRTIGYLALAAVAVLAALVLMLRRRRSA